MTMNITFKTSEPPTDTTLLDPTYHSDTINDFGEMTFYNVNCQHIQPKQLDFTRLLPNFGYVPVDRACRPYRAYP
jgi:hypothetical protein